MREITIKLYKYEELTEKAKERARDWFREGNLYYDWWDSVYEDAATVGKILGISVNMQEVKLMNGSITHQPVIYFSGFGSQGNGAWFAGSYEFAKDAVKRIREYAPQETALWQIADGLQAIQAVNSGAVTATITHYRSANRINSSSISVYKEDTGVDYDTAAAVEELLQDFMKWIYYQLEKEATYLNSDEYIAETIISNEYEFDENGNRV